MSDIIQLLPDSVANQIAAGEVIQRPASVIKELVENAVDAGAKHIDVSVVDAGRTSIQVIDDGKGMSETDARLAFERHATSKIRQADDLFNLHTMGFRGEALPSIVAVAQVELKTRKDDEEIGTDLCMAASKVVSQEPCACPVGANFKVENLFFNVPARRKFLKSNTTELNNIMTAFERIALVYPSVAFTFHSNGTEVYDLRACGLRQRIVDIFGKRINQDLLPIKVETSVCGIAGFVGKPEAAKKKGAKQYFFVNGRYMRHPYFHKAVQTAYERLVPQGDQVPYFIYLDVDPKDIDVNIHPTKTEIKFENEQAIYQILMAAAKDAVGAFSNVATIEFDTEGKPDIPVYDPNSGVQMPKVDYNPQYNPFKETSQSHAPLSQDDFVSHQSRIGQATGHTAPPPHTHPKATPDWEQLYEAFNSQSTPMHTTLFPATQTGQEESMIEDKSPTHYQYKGRYIMTAVKSGLMIIDQHRAHVRILFEQYRKRIEEHKMHSQKVLFPQTVELTAQETVTLTETNDDIRQMGFELTSLGGNTYSVDAIPEGFDGTDVVTLLHDMLAESTQHADGTCPTEDHNGKGGSEALAKLHDTLALNLARAAAIPYGQVLGNDEMENVVNSLFGCSNANYSPDGKTILCILKQNDIEQMLG